MEDLESILKKKYVDVRAEQFDMSPLQYKMKLREALSSGAIKEGKTPYSTLDNYENYLEWSRFWDGIHDQLTRLVWAGIGIVSTALPNYFIGVGLRILPKETFASKESICQFAAFSLGAFIIEKRIGQGIGNYCDKIPTNESPNMKKKDHLKLLSGYVLAQFPIIKRKGQGIGQSIIDLYNKNNSSENRINGAKDGIYEDLLKANQNKDDSKEEKESGVAVSE
jgi:hypothetical protein